MTALHGFTGNIAVPLDGRIGFGLPAIGEDEPTGPQILISDGDPSGVITAPVGTLALDFTTPAVWQNTDGATAWTTVGGGGGGEDLAATLILGNNTGANDIEVAIAQAIRGVDAAGGSGLDGGRLILRPGLGDGAGINGAIQADTFGDPRGENAVDFQRTTFGVPVATEVASGDNSFIAGGEHNTASGDYGSHAEGYGNTASNWSAHAEGSVTTASGTYSHSEGNNTTASGDGAHAEGLGTVASNAYDHAEGQNTTASGGASHSEGANTTASEYGAHAEGGFTEASGTHSHAEGFANIASGYAAHAQGFVTVAAGYYSHSEGLATRADTNAHASHVGGAEALVDRYAQWARAERDQSGVVDGIGGTQRSGWHLAARTTNAVATIMGAAAARPIMRPDMGWTFTGLVTGHDTVGNVISGWRIEGVIRNDGATAVLVGGGTVTLLGQDAGAAAWVVALSAVGANELRVTVTGAAGTTVIWSALIDIAEAGLGTVFP